MALLEGVHVLFLGDVVPGFAETLTRSAERGGAADRLHLRPSVPMETLLAHTRQADVGACLFDPRWLNHRLTLQNKLFEYIAAGLPVVATRDTAFGALVEELGLGWTAALQDVGGLTAVLDRALQARDDPGMRERLAAAARELNWGKEQARLLAVYAELSERRGLDAAS